MSLADGQAPRHLALAVAGERSLRLTPPAPPGLFGAAPAAEPQSLFTWGRMLFKRRWTVIACVGAALALGLAASLLTSPVYTAAATLQIDREGAKVLGKDDGAPLDNQIDGEEFFQTQYGLLRSRSLAVRVAETLGLAGSDDFLRQMKAGAPRGPFRDADAQRTFRRAAVIAALRGGLQVLPNRGSRLVSVAFRSPDAALSARIANAFTENFIAAALDRRYESSSYARDFLEKRLAEVKARLEDTERQLVAYASAKQIIQLGDAGQGAVPGPQQSLASADLQSLSAALSAARAARVQAQARWQAAQKTPGMGLGEILQSPTVQQLSQERAKLAAEYQHNLSVYKPDYPDMLQLQAQIGETDRQLALAAGDIRKSLEVQYQAALDNEKALAAQVEGLKGDVLDLSRRSIQYTILQREVDTNRTLYDGLLQRYKEVGVAGGVAANNISIVDRAEPPLAPSSPDLPMNLALALVGGLAGGIALAFLREALDQAVRTPADVEAKLGLPLLGAIPLLKAGVTPAQALADVRSGLSEAYQSLRSALQFSTMDGFPRTLLVTSPRPGDGKSTTALALAQNAARLGFRALLVDGDLRNASIHRLVGGANEIGLSNLLTGSAALGEAVCAAGQPGLFVVTSGPLPPNPAELLAGARLAEFVREAESLFDLVIFDGSPIMGLADAPLISAAVAGTILVLGSGLTGAAQARAALARLAMARGHLLGVVLTKFNAKAAAYGYGHHYGYDYGYSPAPTGAAGAGRRIITLLRPAARRLAGG